MEDLDPIQKVPTEIWRIVFQNLKHHNDLLSCNRAWNRWGSDPILNPALFMFSHIMDIVMKKLHKNDVLKCREICKEWRNKVDRLYELNKFHLKFDVDPLSLEDNNRPLAEELGWRQEGRVFSNADTIERFLGEMDSNKMNPFMVRCVEFHDGGAFEFWAVVRRFLQVFGVNVWYLNLTFEFALNPNNPAAVEQTLLELLMLTPNIKKLAVDAIELRNPLMNDFTQYHQRVAAIVRENQVPPLPHLELLSFKFNQPSLLFTEIMRSCSNTLTILDYRRYSYDGSIHFPKLQESFTLVEMMEDLNNLSLHPATMKTIYIDTVDYHFFMLTAQQIFGRLERFSATLKDLFLELHIIAPNTPFRANLPHLEKLTLRLNGSLDFLLNLGNLKHLDIFEYVPYTRDNSRIQVAGFEDRMLESNIWELIPSLMTLTLEGQDFNRSQL